MPATVFVRFDAPGPVEVTPRRLHAAWGRVLDLPEGISLERAARLPALAHRPPHDQPGPKPYCLGDMTQTLDGLGVELRFLDDRLLDTLDAWLAWGGVLPIGDGGAGWCREAGTRPSISYLSDDTTGGEAACTGSSRGRRSSASRARRRRGREPAARRPSHGSTMSRQSQLGTSIFWLDVVGSWWLKVPEGASVALGVRTPKGG